MSSTQHQLIVQCATRLRGIIEALDNIHDTSPQRWSTDLDDVHSSAESLLALINDQAPTLDSQGLAGTALRDSPASVEQAGVDERAVFEFFVRKHCGMPEHIAVNWDAKFTNDAWEGWKARAALARVAELEKQEPFYYFADCDDPDYSHLFNTRSDALTQVADHGGRVVELFRLPVAQAQHSVPEGWKLVPMDPTSQMTFVGQSLRYDAVNSIGEIYRQMLAAAPGKEVPQAWLDVQAERLRQVEAEGWMPEHDDAHSHGQMARAAACYALAGSSAPSDGTAALLVSLAWPWDEQWWKPSTARRDMVKACALGLAEIERLDRAAATQGGPRDA
ncbi:hypothetical protein [Pseudomonas aeruginosa]|uniref:hypothetical protein n=1 Tax=Pseudomonas aeruginosa TaxID=287 RepID=UPI000717664B|nr:hypothetical protein [Pseudomonas aeruginosa]KRV35595.1 hypothetical protein AN460_01305 [Pseudomonas aeruginosa]SPY50941.1 Uncharacterised protein [Pseudomonas aeruginosa]